MIGRSASTKHARMRRQHINAYRTHLAKLHAMSGSRNKCVRNAAFGNCLVDAGVDIFDPATGTGSFIVKLLEHFQRLAPKSCATNTRRNATPTRWRYALCM